MVSRLTEVIAAQKGATICGMHLYALSSSQTQECWYRRVTPTCSFMTVSHVSDKGQWNFVHTQLSQLQSFPYLGKAATICNARRDCHGQSPDYLLWNYFYPQASSWGFTVQNDKGNPQCFSRTATHQQWAPGPSDACLGLHKPLCFPPMPQELLHHWEDINKDQSLTAHRLPQGTQRVFSALHVCLQF